MTRRPKVLLPLLRRSSSFSVLGSPSNSLSTPGRRRALPVMTRYGLLRGRPPFYGEFLLAPNASDSHKGLGTLYRIVVLAYDTWGLTGTSFSREYPSSFVPTDCPSLTSSNTEAAYPSSAPMSFASLPPSPFFLLTSFPPTASILLPHPLPTFLLPPVGSRPSW